MEGISSKETFSSMEQLQEKILSIDGAEVVSLSGFDLRFGAVLK